MMKSLYSLALFKSVGLHHCWTWVIKVLYQVKLMGSGVAQLVRRSPPKPEIRGLIPVISKLISNICLQSTVLKRRKQRPGMAHF